MSEKHKKDTHSSRRSREDKYRKKNKYKSYNYESKTPPLPSKSTTSIDELIKKKESLEAKLKAMARYDKKSDNSKNESHVKKRKHEDESIKDLKKKYSKPVKEKKSHEKNMESSPDYNHLDSEDEEYLIEQRRKQRKQLVEKFSNNEIEKEKQKQNTSEAHLECTDSQSHTASNSENRISLNKVTDMFSEEDFHLNSKCDATVKVSKNALSDDWDDSEGYYRIVNGDRLNNRYTIKDSFGQGVFANVVKAEDNCKGKINVAIKIIRNNTLMYKTGLKEIAVLKDINNADPENKYHCVKLLSHFMHKGHLCLVLECLHMDLRAVLKKYGRNCGIHMKALISYSKQLLIALRHLKKVGVVHADIKPDNILVNEKKNLLKLCDFGSAAKVSDGELTPYLVSRFYRAPEIILGIPYSFGIDLWSTACSIYELATGKILFTGSSNNKMIKCFMDFKGRIPNKLLRKGKFREQHFNNNNHFLLHKTDEFTGRAKVVEISSISVTRDLNKELQKSFKNEDTSEEKKVAQLKDMLDKMLMLDPSQRLSVNDCLRHDFIQDPQR